METIGVYSNEEIISKTFNIISDKMTRFKKGVNDKSDLEVEIIQPNSLNTEVIDVIIKFDTQPPVI